MATPVGFVKTGYVTVSSNPGASTLAVYKKTTGVYEKFYAIGGGKVGLQVGKESLVKNASGTVKQLGAFLKANKKAKAKMPAKAPSPAKAKSPAKANVMAGYTKTNVKFGENKYVYKNAPGDYYIQIANKPFKLVKETFVTKPNGSMASLASLNKAKSPSPANAMAAYTKTNLKLGALNVYKKNGDYYYKKTNGQPQKLGQASKVTKPNGTSKPIKVLNYNKTNLKFGSMNVYKNAAGNYYYTNIYTTNKPHKMGKNLEVTKPDGTKATLASLNAGSGQGQYHRLSGMVDQANLPIYYRIESNGKFRFYYKMGSTPQYYHISPSTSIFKETDTAFAHPIKVGDYFQQSNTVYANTGKKRTNGKKV